MRQRRQSGVRCFVSKHLLIERIALEEREERVGGGHGGGGAL